MILRSDTVRSDTARPVASRPRWTCSLLATCCALLLAVALPACGSSDNHDDHHHNHDGGEAVGHPLGRATSDGGHFVVDIDTSTHAARTGENRLELTVESEHFAVEGLTIEVEPWMPGHHHGSNTTPRVEEIGEGRYAVENIVYTMPGLWQLRIELGTGEVSDSIVFAFEVQ